jgi:hypothetical protein
MGLLFYEFGGGNLFLYESPSAGTNQATAVSFDVPDILAFVDDLSNNGVRFEHYDTPGMTLQGDIHVIDGTNVKSAWFKDTEGNIYNITQSD